MVIRNPYFAHFQSNYLFPEIARRVKLLQERQPNARFINLGVGDTTQPIPPVAAENIADKARQLQTKKGYRGYGPEQGEPLLREKLAEHWYKKRVEKEELFINDGAKCDLARLQLLFGSDAAIALQDPGYPVYVDNAVLIGASGEYAHKKNGYSRICYLPCHPENRFFPDLSKAKRADLLFFCSPNNPTGHIATKQQLEELVAFAHKNRSIIIFDTAYAAFIQDPSLPISIYEIEGAKEVAIEVGSFSKLAGFTGIRLGWTVVPKELRYDCEKSVLNDWRRLVATTFNGASSLAAAGGIALFSEEAQPKIKQLRMYYAKNAALLRSALQKAGWTVYGGQHAPYLWAKTSGSDSWKLFDHLLEQMHLITTPGAGFGPSGEGFLRFSALGARDDILEAAQRLENRAAQLPRPGLLL